jgi:hypothetical protein
MANPSHFLRVLPEIVFVFLGVLVIWVATTGHYFFDPRSMAWLLLAGLLAIYGLVTVRWRGPERGINWVRGGSLMLIGLIMLALSRARMNQVTPLLIVAGVVLASRGVIVAALVLAASPKAR